MDSADDCLSPERVIGRRIDIISGKSIEEFFGDVVKTEKLETSCYTGRAGRYELVKLS